MQVLMHKCTYLSIGAQLHKGILVSLPTKADLHGQMVFSFQSVLSYHANVFISPNAWTQSLIPTVGCCRQGNQRKAGLNLMSLDHD